MHIILVSAELATAKSIHLGWRHLLAVLGLFILAVLSVSSLFSYIAVRHAAAIRLPLIQDMLSESGVVETQRSQDFMRENLNAMATRLGQLQAQVIRLNSIGERISILSGLGTSPDRGGDDIVKDGRGGPLLKSVPLSPSELKKALDDISIEIDARSDNLSLIETQLLDDRLRKNLLPTTLPVAADWISSFGWRIDPITGERAMHEGVDFPAPMGTQVISAAAGIVTHSEVHPEYGNLVEIDHGNELSTRYAHLSTALVKPGSLIKRGQVIGLIGTTGRSTGPHLHFEVRIQGLAHNPTKFLKQSVIGQYDRFSLTHQH